jgi:hypothetical protein
MEENVKDFINDTSEKIAKIEKKIKEMKMNIVILSFYTDLKLIEESIMTYESHGFEVSDELYVKIEKLKLLLHSKKDLPALSKTFIEVTEELYKLKKRIDTSEKQNKKKSKKNKIKSGNKSDQKQMNEFLLAYI